MLLAGAVGVAIADGPADDELMPIVELSGPVRKNVPAMGLPRFTEAANVVVLKLFRGVLALISKLAVSLKFAGCTYKRRT